MKYYIASCVFTAKYPELSRKIRQYVTDRHGMEAIRCCTPQYKVKIYEEKMPEGQLREEWKAMRHTLEFQPGDETWSICHNCSNLIEEMYPETKVSSIWELIDQDPEFELPDYSGLEVTLQDCWRSKDRASEQSAVRSLLKKMNITFVEARPNRSETNFCGSSLYRPQVPRNPNLAPKHYKYGAEGLFQPHTEEEQLQNVKNHCSQYVTDTVVVYCHTCLEGLQEAGIHGMHLAHMIFEPAI